MDLPRLLFCVINNESWPNTAAIGMKNVVALELYNTSGNLRDMPGCVQKNLIGYHSMRPIENDAMLVAPIFL
jgi:hypothetical protein